MTSSTILNNLGPEKVFDVQQVKVDRRANISFELSLGEMASGARTNRVWERFGH